MKVLTIQEPKDLRSIMVRAWDYVKEAVLGGPIEVHLLRPSKSREQEKKYHAMIRDIARSMKDHDLFYSDDAWKALLVDEFEQEMTRNGTPLKHPSRTILSLDKERAVTIRSSTKEFLKSEANNFIEFLYFWGAEHSVDYSDESLSYYEELDRDN